MRNTWKGLVVGGLTGLAGGAVLDVMVRASGHARGLGESAKAHVHEVSQRVHAASQHVDGSQIGSRLTDTAKELAHATKDAGSRSS